MKRPIQVVFAVLVLAAFWMIAVDAPCAADAAPPTQAGAKSTAAASQPGVVKFSRKMPAGALAHRPGTDVVELSNGRRVSLGDVRRLKAAAAKLRAAPGSKLPPALRTKPAATGTPLRNSADLASSLKRSDHETVVLPSGRRVTVGMIRFLRPEVEKKLGRPLSSTAMPAGISGPVVKVDAKSDWKSIFQKPDATVLEAPNGARITVGALKEGLVARRAGHSLPPAKR